MKNKRHLKIINIIKNENIKTQEELAEALQNEGIEVTQATVSRDIKDLGLIKIATEDDSYKYALPSETDRIKMVRRIETMFKNFVLELDVSSNLIIIKTVSGTASGLASAIDNLEWKEILGCVAGDDAILLVVDENSDRDEVADRLKGLIGID